MRWARTGGSYGMQAAAGSDTTVAMRRCFVVALAVAAACGGREPRTRSMTADKSSPSPLAADAVAGVTSDVLQRLLADHWEWRMRRSPTWATILGDHRFDDQLPLRAAAEIERDQAERRALLARGRAIDPR